MSDWQRAKVPNLQAVLANARSWVKPVEDGLLLIIRTIEPTPDQSAWLTHLSISHSGFDGKPGRYPTWDEQKEACREFAKGKRLVSFMPAEDDVYVNEHPTTFHWWETRSEEWR